MNPIAALIRHRGLPALCSLFTCLRSPLFAFLPEDVMEGVCYELDWDSSCLLYTCLCSPLFAFLPEDVVEGVRYELDWDSVVGCVCMTHPWYAVGVCLLESLARLECVTSTVRCAEAHSRWLAIWLQRHFLLLSDRYVRSLRREYRLFVGRFISSRDLRLSKFHNRGIVTS